MDFSLVTGTRRSFNSFHRLVEIALGPVQIAFIASFDGAVSASGFRLSVGIQNGIVACCGGIGSHIMVLCMLLVIVVWVIGI